MRIVSPIVGWIPLYKSLITTEPFPSQEVERKQKLQYNNYGLLLQKVPLEVILHPVTDLQFNNFGGVRLHVSICGHAMHVKCHANVMATIRTNSHNRTHYEGSQAVDAKRGEMLCPLCKGVANTLLPHVPPHLARTRLPLTAPETSDNDEKSDGIDNFNESEKKVASNSDINNGIYTCIYIYM
jgi:hypothetical protein